MNSQTLASQYLKDISQKTSYGLEWQYQEELYKKKLLIDDYHMNNHLEIIKKNNDHITLNKQHFKREPSKKYNLKKWENKQNLLHKIQYPLISDDTDMDLDEQVFLLSKLAFHQNYPSNYSILFNQKSTQICPNNFISSQISKAKLEILRKRELQTKKLLKYKVQYRPKGQLLPSIPIKHQQSQTNFIKKPIKNILLESGQGQIFQKHSRKCSMPNLSKRQNIIKLIQF